MSIPTFKRVRLFVHSVTQMPLRDITGVKPFTIAVALVETERDEVPD
jgi:hypothetical protein